MDKKESVAPASATQTETVEGSLSGVFDTPTHKSFSETFTTEPKNPKKLTFHKHTAIRNRVYALQESFDPIKTVKYDAVKMRMMTLLGISDRTTVLAYLGRPAHEPLLIIDHDKHYEGKVTHIKHYMRKKLKPKKGYIDIYGLGRVFTTNKGKRASPENPEDLWFIQWNHKGLVHSESSPQPPLKRDVDEGLGVGVARSKDFFSLPICSPQDTRDCTHEEKREYIDRERRERDVVGERNCETESKQRFPITQHSNKVKLNALEEAIPRISKEGDSK